MGRKKVTDADLVEAAEKLVAEAMAPYENLLGPEEKALMRFLLEADLLVDPQGRLDLRRALGDPELERSDEVRLGDAEDDDRGEGEGTA